MIQKPSTMLATKTTGRWMVFQPVQETKNEGAE